MKKLINRGLVSKLPQNHTAKEWDRDLNYKYKSNFLHLERAYKYPLSYESYVIHTNDNGFRYPPQNTLQAIALERNRKIIIMGGSLTMGLGVDSEFSYPAQLQKFLDEGLPDKKFHVFNMGVASYSSFQGVVLLKKILSFLKAGDIVILGYNGTDAQDNLMGTDEVGKNKVFLNEKEFNAFIFNPERGCTTIRLLRLFSRLFFMRFKKSVSFWQYTPRISYEDCYSNNLRMIQWVKSRGAKPILFYHGRFFVEQNYDVRVLHRLSELTHTPIVDVYDRMRELEKLEDREREKGLVPAAETDLRLQDAVKITFRISLSSNFIQHFLGSQEAKRFELNILNGSLEKTTSFLLNDSGESGDETAHDGIWSGTVTLRPDPKTLKFSPIYHKNGRFQEEYDVLLSFFFNLFAGGKEDILFSENRFPKLKLSVVRRPWLRRLSIGKIKNVDSDIPDYNDLINRPRLFYGSIITPVYSFGKRSFRSDFIHPTKIGYRIFAEELYKVISQGKY